MIKYIHCFGTSYTAGGGHEFDATGPSRSLNSSRPEARKHLENLIEVYSKKYPNEEQTLYNCSWPGQLQKLLGEDIQVINHAKSGYGNERMYEITYDIVSKPDFNKDEHLFLYEFSALGRKQLWSNTLNQYIITNYIIDDKNKLNYNGTAVDYFYDNNDTIEITNKLEEIIKPFYEETLEMKSSMRRLEINNHMFLDYLSYNNVNWMFTADPFYYAFERYDKKHYFKFSDNSHNFVNYFHEEDLTITKETNGKVNDGHMSITGAKIIARVIAKRLKELNYLKELYLLL